MLFDVYQVRQNNGQCYDFSSSSFSWLLHKVPHGITNVFLLSLGFKDRNFVKQLRSFCIPHNVTTSSYLLRSKV